MIDRMRKIIDGWGDGAGPFVYSLSVEGADGFYVGSSANPNPNHRRLKHIYGLRRGTHHNARLQEAFRNAGSRVDLIRYRILGFCAAADVRAVEQWMIDGLTGSGLLLNASTLSVGTRSDRQRLSVAIKNKEYEWTGDKRRAASELRDSIKKTVTVNGVEYLGVSEAARSVGISKQLMMYRLRSDGFPEYKKGGKNDLCSPGRE